MSFFLISLMAIAISAASVVGVAYIRVFYWVYYVSKVFKYILEFRMKTSDKAIFFLIFLYTFGGMFSKDFYLHYSLIGHIYHTDEELIFKMFVFCLASLFILTPNLAFARFLYRSDVLRTLIIVGFGFSDLMAINWVSRKYSDGNMTELRYIFTMGTVSCPPGMLGIFKESLSLQWGNITKAFMETRNICLWNIMLAGINIWSLDYLRTIESNYALVSFQIVNAVGMTLYFSFKSYQFGKMLEEKIRKENEIEMKETIPVEEEIEKERKKEKEAKTHAEKKKKQE